MYGNKKVYVSKVSMANLELYASLSLVCFSFFFFVNNEIKSSFNMRADDADYWTTLILQIIILFAWWWSKIYIYVKSGINNVIIWAMEYLISILLVQTPFLFHNILSLAVLKFTSGRLQQGSSWLIFLWILSLLH